MTLDDIACLKRFICTCDDMSDGIAQCVHRLIDNGKGEEVVKIAVQFSSGGEHLSSKTLVVGVLALCTTKDLKTKQAAYQALNEVCDTPPLLFQFLACVAKQTEKGKSGFGRVKRKAVARWYNSKTPKDLAVFVTRYRRRSKWSHVDLVRLAHTKPGNPGVDFILKYVTKGLTAAKQHLDGLKEGTPDTLSDVIKYLEAVEKVKHSHDEQEVARLIEQFQLAYEHVPTWFIKNSKEVWHALVPHMSLTTILSNLSKMAAIGLLNPGPGGSVEILKKQLESDTLLTESRIHPFTIQTSLKLYEGGKVGRSLITWIPNPEICKALQNVFYKAIALYQPTGKRYLLAVDVSASMFNNLSGAPLLMSSVWAAASMSLGILRKETHRHLVAIGGSALAVDVAKKDVTVEQLCKDLEQHKKDGPSDLSSSIAWASEKKETVEAFVMFTDQIRFNEGGKLVESFRNYCKNMNVPSARLVVVSYNRVLDQAGMDDRGILFLRGLDPATPEIIHSFVSGKLD